MLDEGLYYTRRVCIADAIMPEGQVEGHYMTLQLQAPPLGAYGSSRLSTGPHTEGNKKSLVFLQYLISEEDASDTLTLGLSRSSLRRWLYSMSLRNLSSVMDCFVFLGPAVIARGE